MRLRTGNNVTINGATYSGNDICINNGNVIIDGVVVNTIVEKHISVTVNGDVDSLELSSGDVKVAGDCKDVKTTSGSVSCKNVSGSVTTVSGDVKCKTVNGSVKTVSGDIVKHIL